MTPRSEGRELTIGIDLAPPEPFQIGRPESGEMRGFEVDLLGAVAKELGIELRFRRAPWSEIMTRLQGGELDLICSAATITDELRRKFDFGIPYCDVALGIVSAKDSAWNGVEDLQGRRIAVRAGTSGERLVQQCCRPAHTDAFETNDEVYDALVSELAEATVDDIPIACALTRKYRSLRVGPPIPGTESHYAMVFRKGNTLRMQIDRILRRLTRDGFIAQAHDKWLAHE